MEGKEVDMLGEQVEEGDGMRKGWSTLKNRMVRGRSRKT